MSHGHAAITNTHLKDNDQVLVELFMAKMMDSRQHVPVRPTMPSLEVRKLRAQLMLEEVLETIRDGLGLSIKTDAKYLSENSTFEFDSVNDVNLAQVADGCADVAVVTLGTASACGLAMKPIYKLVMSNNLLKFAPGHFFRADGKLVKPPDFPDIADSLAHEIAAQCSGITTAP